MGNAQSRLFAKLQNSLPNPDSSSSWFDSKRKPFANHEDKNQFIYATITVLSQNGSINLENHDVRLLYSRRENDRLVARIIAEQEGVVKAQVVARDDGKDQDQAFQQLRTHVERTLDTILKDVPGASYSGGKTDVGGGLNRAPMESGRISACGPSSPTRTTSGNVQRQEIQPVPIEAPPAYGKAVRNWKNGHDEKSYYSS